MSDELRDSPSRIAPRGLSDPLVDLVLCDASTVILDRNGRAAEI